MRSFLVLPSVLLLLSLSSELPVAKAQEGTPKPPPPKAYADPAKTDEDFPLMGEYVGEYDGNKFGVQIWAQGGGKFESVTYPGGLPGAGWEGDRDAVKRDAWKREGAKAVFKEDDIQVTIDGSAMVAKDKNGNVLSEFKKVERKSPTLGAPPPEGAVVLFDGKGVNRFPKSRVTEDGLLLMEGITSEDTFGDCTVHVEFRLPYMPEARGQGRGNSGLYLQGRYEVQMLDSFGLEGKDNECGGLYKIAAPKVNLCLPPLAWQTYDVDFTAAKYDAAGKKTANARITVKHNGVAIHEDQELPGTTTSAPNKEENTPGPLHLQNHGSPVRYRNIWVKAGK